MHSLVSRATGPTKLDQLLRRLQSTQSLPSIIDYQNLLTELDLARHPPSVPLTALSSRSASQLHSSSPTVIASVDFAPDEGDHDFDWIDADRAQWIPVTHRREEHGNQHGDLETSLYFSPDFDQDGDEPATVAAWEEILIFSQSDHPNNVECGLGGMTTEGESQRGSILPSLNPASPVAEYRSK